MIIKGQESDAFSVVFFMPGDELKILDAEIYSLGIQWVC